MQNSLQSLRLTLLNIDRVKLDSTWDYDNVISPFTRIYYITEGNAKVYHNNQQFNLKPGYIYLIPSYTYSRYKCDRYHEQYYISLFEEMKNGLSIYNFKHFRYEIEANEIDLYYFKRLLEINPSRALVKYDPEVYDNIPSLQNFIKKNELLSTDAYIETQGILSILLSRFIEDYKFSKSKIGLKNNLSDVLSYVNENIHKNLTVEKMASYCHLNSDYFSRVFYENFGMRPNKYIQSKRIERAQLLLLTTNNSLKEIAEKIGIESLSHFSKTFKNITGKTPGSFRKEQMNV